MRKVIDSNYLRDPGLSKFLRTSCSNWAVLPDYIAWEAYKKDPLITLDESLQILSNHASQVIVLKSMKRIIRQSPRKKGYVKRMIDKKQTLEFGKFCRGLRLAKQGDPSHLRSIIDRSNKMRDYLVKLEESLTHTVETRVDDFRKLFKADEWRLIRAGSPTPEKTQLKYLSRIFAMAQAINKVTQASANYVDSEEFANTIAFRYALALTLLDESWAKTGGARNVRPERHLNDEIDVNILVYATYFDGFLSNDKRAARIYSEARQQLKDLGC